MDHVVLKVYDLSQGMASQLSTALLGRQIDGIWHTGVQVFGREYYFGGGICSDPPGLTPYGVPVQEHDLGQTNKTQQEFITFLSSISSRFTMQTYHLLDNNCNNFSDQCCIFLIEKHIPQHILDLPSIAMNSPLGPFIRPAIDSMQSAIQQQSMGHEVSLPSNAGPTDTSNPPTTNFNAASSTASTSSSVSHEYCSTPITLSKGNLSAISRKLEQFLPDFSDFNDVPSLVAICIDGISLPKAFPALDMLRILVLENTDNAEEFASAYPLLIERYIIDEDSPDSACMMALRGGVNCLVYESCAQILCEEETSKSLTKAILNALTREKPQVIKTAALLAYNFVGAHPRHPNTVPKLCEDVYSKLTFALMKKINKQVPLPTDEARLILQTLVILADYYPAILVMIKVLKPGLEVYRNKDVCRDPQVLLAANQLSQLIPPSS